MTGTTPAAWNDPVKGGELAKARSTRAPTSSTHAAGGTGLGVLQAAADAGKLGIGVDSNQNYLHPGKVLTSMLKRVDVAVYNAFKDAKDGNWTPGIQVLGLDGGRRRLCARRQQQGADHPGDEGRGRRGQGRDHRRRDQGPRLHDRQRLPGSRTADGRAPDARPAAGERPAAGAGAALAIELIGIDKRFGAGPRQPGHRPRGRARHDPRHRRRERRRQVDADVDPLRLLPGRCRRDPRQRQADRRSTTARRRDRAPASAWSTSTSCWSRSSPCSRTSCSAPRAAPLLQPRHRQGARASCSGSSANTASRSIPTRSSTSCRSACSSASRSSRRSIAAPTS